MYMMNLRKVDERVYNINTFLGNSNVFAHVVIRSGVGSINGASYNLSKASLINERQFAY